MATTIPAALLPSRMQAVQYLGNAVWHLMIGNPALGNYNPSPSDREAVRILLSLKGQLC